MAFKKIHNNISVIPLVHYRFRHYILILGGGRRIYKGCLLENYFTDFTWPMREAKGVINFDVTVFGLGGFSNIEHLTVWTFHGSCHSIVSRKSAEDC